MEEKKLTPIEVNLRLPEDSGSRFDFADVIRFLWGGRKMIMICTLVGILTGIVAAGVYYKSQKSKVITTETAEVNTGVATAALQYFFLEAERGLTPNSQLLRPALILSDAVMDRAVEILGSGVTPAMLRADFKVENPVIKGGEYDYSTVRLTHTIGVGSEWSNTGLSGDAGMEAIIQAYKEYFNEQYSYAPFIEADVIRMLHHWDDYFKWSDNLIDSEYNEAFLILEKQYGDLLSYLRTLYDYNPSFEHDGFSLVEYYVDTQNNFGKITDWKQETYTRLYLDDVDAFTKVAPERLSLIEQEISTLTAQYDRYIDILATKPSANMVEPTVENPTSSNIFYEAKQLADKLYNYENEIACLSQYMYLLTNDIGREGIVGDTSEAADAIDYFIRDLVDKHDNGSVLIRAYYEEYFTSKLNPPDEMIIVSQRPVFIRDTPQLIGGVKSSQILLLFVVFSVFGFAAGIVALYLKKLIINIKTV